MSRVCCIVNCGSRSPNNCDENRRTLFKIPQEISERKSWLGAIAPYLRRGRAHRKHLYVCDLHFRKEDVIRNNVTILADGTQYNIPRRQFSLKAKSLPSIFSVEKNSTKTVTMSVLKNLDNNGHIQQQHAPRSWEKAKPPNAITAAANTSTQSELQSNAPSVPEDLTENQMRNLYDAIFEEIIDGITDTTESTDLQTDISRSSAAATDPGHLTVDTIVEQLKEIPSDRDSARLCSTTARISTVTSTHESFSVEENITTAYNITALEHDLNATERTKMPANWGFVRTPLGICLLYFGDTFANPTRSILVQKDMKLEIRANGNIVRPKMQQQIRAYQDVISAMTTLGELSICKGIDERIHCSYGFFEAKSSLRSTRCMACRVERVRKMNRESKCSKRDFFKRNKLKKDVRNLKRKLNRSEKNVIIKRETIGELQTRLAEAPERVIEEVTKDFSSAQREAFKSCVAAAKCKGPTGIRYSNPWVLECLLIRIKSRRAYVHLRNHNIIQAPTIDVLNRYLRNMKSEYGWCEKTFDLLRGKAAAMNPHDRRGIIVLDELKLSESVSFDRKTLLFKGFTDLGDHTPENQKSERGDHGLVFMFQPFRGKWVQSLGAFLSKGCANSTILHHLVLECIVLLENAGFFVDVITTDGASWNRTMWKRFSLEESDTSCEHPFSLPDDDDENLQSHSQRRLWFCSDFSHLAKNFRNFLMAEQMTWTPDGAVKKAHFNAVIDHENSYATHGLKIAHKLTKDHTTPRYYQKMNVAMAFQLFAPPVSAAMKLLKDDCKDLNDCEGSVKLIERFHEVIVAMTARCPKNALAYGTESYKIIMNFLEYLEEWKHGAAEKNYRFMSSNTYHGLRVTLKTAIEVMTFLTGECGYQYFMTARLNQDALEGFFGMIRGACGSTDHPDSLLFIQVYRLMTFYSLVKPPKGSNVEGSEIFEILLTSNDLNSSNQNKAEWDRILDHMVERKEHNHPEYDENSVQVNEYAQAYFSGFVAKQIEKWTSCLECIASITKSDRNSPKDGIIHYMSKGFLKYASDALFNLLSAVERALLKTVNSQQLNAYTFIEVAGNVLAERISLVGCAEHNEALTKNIINYYATSRAHILCKSFNKINNSKKKEEKEHRKRAKLVGGLKITEALDERSENHGFQKVPRRKRAKKTENLINNVMRF